MRQVIDLTLGTILVGSLVSDWHVSSEESLSRHRYIYFKSNYRYWRLWFTGTPRRSIGLDIDKTFQLSLGVFQRTYLRGWTWSWPLMKCSSPFSCPIIIIAKLGLLVRQEEFLGGLHNSASLGHTQEGSLTGLNWVVIGIICQVDL